MNKYPKISLKIVDKKGRELSTFYAGTNRRFFGKIRACSKRGCRYFIKVTYAPGFKNEGEYTNKKDAIHALAAFTEKDLVEEFL